MRILSQLKKMKEDMETTLMDIAKEGEASGGELIQAARQITKNCRQHANELFAEVKDNSGNVVEIMRPLSSSLHRCHCKHHAQYADQCDEQSRMLYSGTGTGGGTTFECTSTQATLFYYKVYIWL